MSTHLEGLEATIGHRFRDRRLLEQALTHRSFGVPNNERLEFLGDGILNCVIAMALFERFGHLREGEMSRLRADLVRQAGLHGLATQLVLGEVLRLGEGELKSGGASRPSILADALEAIFAAVFLDAGFAAAQGVIERLYAPLLAGINARRVEKDPKTALQEWLQGRYRKLPSYAVRRITGEDHAQCFEVECNVAGLGLSSTGSGPSRRAAEQDAAAALLRQLAKEPT